MEISKLNNISFGGLKKEKKPFVVKPNKENHTNRSGLIILGLIATGAVAGAILVKKNKITLPVFNKKTDSVIPKNINKETAIIENAKEKTTQTIQQEPEKITEVLQDNSDKLQEQKTVTVIAKNARNNDAFIQKSMQKHPELYEDFGIDEEITECFTHLNHELVNGIKDDEFLSLLLAPGNKLMLGFDEAMRGIPYKNKLSRTLNNTLLKHTRRAKQFKTLDRKLRLNSVVKSVLPNEERIAKLREMEETFSPEDIEKIFTSESSKGRNSLLSWLMGFHTKEMDKHLLENILDIL